MARKRRIEGGLSVRRATPEPATEPPAQAPPADRAQRKPPEQNIAPQPPRAVAEPKRLQARVALSPGTRAALMRVARFESTGISQTATALFLAGHIMYLAGQIAPRSALTTRSHSRQLRFRYTYYPPGLWEPVLEEIGRATDAALESSALRQKAREALKAPAPAAPWESLNLTWMTVDVPREVRDAMAALARVHDTSAGYLAGVFVATGILAYVAREQVAHIPFQNKEYARSLGNFIWNISVPSSWLSLCQRLVADLRLPGQNVPWDQYGREAQRLLARAGDSWTFLA